MAKSKTILLWQSDERLVELKTHHHPHDNIFDEELEKMNGTKTRITLKTGEKIDAILVSNDECLIAVRTFFPNMDVLANLTLIPVREVVSVAVA